jgi:hypothetical protein
MAPLGKPIRRDDDVPEPEPLRVPEELPVEVPTRA